MSTTFDLDTPRPWGDKAQEVAFAFGDRKCHLNSENDTWAEYVLNYEDRFNIAFCVSKAESFVFSFGFPHCWVLSTSTVNGKWKICNWLDDDRLFELLLRPIYALAYPATHPAYTLLCQHGYELTAHEQIEALLNYKARMAGMEKNNA